MRKLIEKEMFINLLKKVMLQKRISKVNYERFVDSKKVFNVRVSITLD